MTKCSETVRSGDPWVGPKPCSRAAKETIDGKALCGVHAGALKRRKAKHEQWHEQREADKQHRERISELAERTGVAVQTNFAAHKLSRTTVVVPLDWFEAQVEARSPSPPGG